MKNAFLMALCLTAGAAMADDSSGSGLKLSGFARATAGMIVSGSGLDGSYAGPSSIKGVQCPCYTADWSNGGVYGRSLTLEPETEAGIQANYSLTPKTSLVGQVVVRASTGEAELAWAYASHRLDQNWEVSLGRKRIPLYYYSDFQDIGLSYPWVSPPPELYGWDASNYNGASIRFNKSYSGVGVNASVFGGFETVDKSPYYKLFYSTATQVKWNNIAGADLELTKGPATVRGIYVRADTRAINAAESIDASASLKAMGIAFNLDYDSWFILSEATQLTRSFTGAGPYSYRAPAYTVGVGVRLGKWTPFVNYAAYTEHSSDLSLYSPQSYRRASLTMRYDLDAGSALKAQIDRNIDATQNFGGSSTIIRLSYDKVF